MCPLSPATLRRTGTRVMRASLLAIGFDGIPSLLHHRAGRFGDVGLLQGGMSGKGILLAKPSGPLGTSFAWRTLFWAYMTMGHVSFM